MKTSSNPTRNRATSRNFAGQNLRGKSFIGQDLSEADFSGADLRGTNFSKAILKRANFTGAKCGLQKRWVVLLTMLSWLLAGVSGFFSIFTGFLVALIFESEPESQVAGWVSLLVIVVFLVFAIFKGLRTVAVAGAVAGAGAGAVAVAGAVAGAVAVAGAGAGALVGIWLGWRAMKGNPRDAWIRDFAVAFAALGGTSFQGANLTEANFSAARLKSTDMREANLTRVRWYGAKMLDRVRPGSTYLKNTQVRQWLLGDGVDKNFDGQNLQGVNFQGAYLTNASFISTNLSEADLSDTTLTGACIQDWNINNQTKFDQVICDYIYLKAKEKERIPHDPNREFQSGEFEQYIKKAINTVDLIFNDGIDWKAFFTSFQALQSEYGVDQIGVQAIERKSKDAFVVRLEVPADANKAEIESKAKKKYDTELKKLESQHRKTLEAKDETIAAQKEAIASLKNRHGVTDMDNIVKILGSLPPPTIQNIIDISNTAESKTVSDTFNNDLKGANIANFANKVEGNARQQANQYNYASEQKQNLTEAAAEIQQLLEQLAQTNPTANEAEQIKHLNDETSPKFKRKAYAALKAARDTALDEFLDNSYVKVAKDAILAWIDA